MKKHFAYWIGPAILLLLYIFIYFFDIFGMSYLMAPEYNREFGFVETTQAIVIIGIVLVCLMGFNHEHTLVRYFFRIGLPVSVFIFLEEIDYGLHFYDWYVGKTTAMINAEYETGVRNLHNSFDLTNGFKKLAYVFLAFVCLLEAKPQGVLNFRFLNKFQSLIPDRFRPDSLLALTVILIPVINQVAFFIKNNFEVKSNVLKGNLSEFEETLIYYAAFLYVFQVLKKNTAGKENAPVRGRQTKSRVEAEV